MFIFCEIINGEKMINTPEIRLDFNKYFSLSCRDISQSFFFGEIGIFAVETRPKIKVLFLIWKYCSNKMSFCRGVVNNFLPEFKEISSLKCF
jgi:hypothetical protein